jgi:xanthine dehydrogenase YagR molybdenum-binding subunit
MSDDTLDPQRPEDDLSRRQFLQQAAVGGAAVAVAVDGRLKVTGAARYAAEAEVPDVTHGVLVTSTIARGKIANIDASAAEKMPGVLAVLTHRNAPRVKPREELPETTDPLVGRPLQPLQDDVVYHHGQPVAVVVADTLERAVHAASLVRLEYLEERAVTDFASAAARAHPPTQPGSSDRGTKKPPDYRRGDPDKALAEAAVRVEHTYTIPAEHHNPMELHATVAVWEGSKLTLYDKTQWVDYVQKVAASVFGLPVEDVRVISPFVGGAFGSALRAWPHVLIAALTAKHVRRPVKLALTRAQMFTVPGYRPHTAQKVALGATKDGKLAATQHDATAQTSTYEEYTETVLNPSRMLYACPNVGTRYRLAPMNVNTPASMRAPGEATGVYALECALDELAVALGIDPVELRLLNHADRDPQKDLPWSSKSLKECYGAAAERFGWSRRNPKPRSMREGRLLVGLGMASATWPTYRRPATALVRILRDGTAVVRTAASDIGPGTYTVMTQIAADALGLPVGRVRFELGDTRMPPAPVQGGSMTVASVGPAVQAAARAARDEVLALAADDDGSALHRAGADDVGAEDGRLFLKSHPSSGESYAAILQRHHKEAVEVRRESKPGEEQKKFSMHAFGAHFVEVRVDPDLGTVRVARVVSGFAAGRIINPKTAHSQAIGGIVGGLGMALTEETVWDARNGRVVNANLADYHVPVHADVPPLEAFFVDEEDAHANPLGAKGLAELALVGVAAAVANAVYHATGRRVRDLPITPDKLL